MTTLKMGRLHLDTTRKSGCPLQEISVISVTIQARLLCLVRETPAVNLHDLVFLARTSLMAAKDSNSSSSATSTYNKLSNRTIRPLHVISVQPHTVTINKAGVPNTVSFDQVFHAPAMPTTTTLSHLRQTHTRSETNSALNVPKSLSSRYSP